MNQHWIFDLAEHDPDRLLSMSEKDFRAAMADAGCDVDELAELFHTSVGKILLRAKDAKD